MLFLLETNPGPGLGVLLAYWLFSKGSAKASAPGAVIIHFFGGIHEIYFPYILMQPALIIAPIAGSFVGQLIFVITGAGEVASPSPGSIIALLAVAEKSSIPFVLLGVAASAAVSFLVASPLVKKNAAKIEADDSALENAKSSISSLKSNGALRVVFACDAGMGSSAMGASRLKKMLKEKGAVNVTVEHFSVDSVPKDAQLIVCQKSLAERARQACPEAQVYPLSNLVSTAEYEPIVEQILKVAN